MRHGKIFAAAVAIGAALGAGTALAQGPGARHGMSFDNLDADRDGKITRSELETRHETRFKQSDANGDGVLSKEELIEAGVHRVQTRVTAMLDRFDTDKDGALSITELPQPRGDRAGRMFDRMDANGDGSVSQAEFDTARSHMAGRKMQKSGQN